tara:strand:+ start:26422 stop:27198 length:777 start_codon:yes stop_codon:yes gene_type:complete
MKNFGFIKNSFNNKLSENISRKNAKGSTTFKSYIKQIKESDSLRTQFLIYKNLEDKIEENELTALEFVKENIAFMNVFSKDEIVESINKLISIDPSVLKLEDVYENDDIKELHENVSYLILTNKNPTTIGSIIEATNKVVNYIQNNQPKVITEDLGVPNSLLLSLFVDKYNEKYDDLDESHKKAIKIITESNEDEKEEFFKESISKCLGIVNERLVNSEISVKESLLGAKENLLNKEFEPKTFLTDITKILELTEDLK